MMGRNLNINITPKKYLRSPRYLSFFFVDDTGRLFCFENVKALAVSILILVIVSVLAAGIAVKFALDLNRKNQVLHNEITEKNNENIRLKEQNRAITAAYIERNSQETNNASEPVIEGENKIETREKKFTANVSTGVQPEAGQKNADTGKSVEEISKRTAKTEQAFSTPSNDPETEVFEVNNFFVTHNPETKMLNVQFKLSKMSGAKGKKGGQTAVILYGKADNNEIRLVLPVNAKVDDQFKTVIGGKSFLISNYNYIRMSLAFRIDTKFLKNAAVLVCDAEGKMISEKNFPITIK